MTKVPEILLIYTGGTIGMIKDYNSNALRAFNFNHLYEKIPELNQLQCNIESISFETPIGFIEYESSVLVADYRID